MTSRGRLAVALAVVAVSVTLPFARTPAGGAHPGPTVAFSAQGLSFRYPAAWRPGTWNGDVSSFSASIVYLSTSRLHDPCTVTTSPGETSVTCTNPVATLPPGGILAEWSEWGFPDYRMPKPDTTIGGRPAVEARTTGGAWCASLGGTKTITAMIPRDAPDNWYQMDACLRAPGLLQREAQISAMLTAVRIGKDR